jgi:biotin carboxyl carrier protein
MKLHAEGGEERHEVELRREGGNVFARVDGREYDLDVSEPEPGVYLFKNNGRVTEIFVSPGARPSDPVQVQTGGNSYKIRLIDPKRLRGSGGGGEHGDGAAEISTAMPGKVVRILLQTGAAVAKGEGVLVVEAMKMQNELKAPKAGTIKQIKVEEGATVSTGDVLAVIE